MIKYFVISLFVCLYFFTVFTVSDFVHNNFFISGQDNPDDCDGGSCPLPDDEEE